MVALLKRLCLASLVLAFATRTASAFSLLGPLGLETYQAAVIGYGIGGDVGDPRNIAQEYRWNTPVVYYAFDQNFLDYFGSNGVAAVESGLDVLDRLKPLSSYSSALTEFPLNTERINYAAQAANMFDLKSAAMNLVLEELGLAQAERWVWTLRGRVTQPGLSCPFMIYTVIQRNYDPTFLNTGQYSSYINGTLYDYRILEACTGPNPLALTFNFPVDPTASTPSTVANVLSLISQFGTFFTGLTRDDVGGLRYMLSPTNINSEAVSPDSLLIDTNNSLQLITTTNFAQLYAAALTNPPAQLLALFPGLVINSFSQFPTNIVTSNITATLTVPVGAPPGSSPTLKLTTTYTTNFVIGYNYVFGNVVTNTVSFQTFISQQTVTTGVPVGAPPGSSPVTTTNTTVTALQNVVTGDYFLVPTNACGFTILSNLQANVTLFTNFNITTNGTVGTFTLTNSFTLVTFFTNHVLLAQVPNCVAGTLALRHGIDKISFVRANYDSLIGTFFQPITNTYTLTAQTNSGPFTQTFQRTVVRPDFLFSAGDPLNNSGLGTELGVRTAPNFDSANIPAQNPGEIAGPGTIAAPVIITFDNVGPVLINVFNPLDNFFFGLAQSDGVTNFVWGSFDATTNAPVTYPNGTSVLNFDAQMYLGVANVFLPGGNSQPPTLYSAQLQALGNATPFTWALSPRTVGPLPPGLALSSSPPGTNAVISGTASAAGVYDFTVRLSDSAGRSVDQNLVITIH
jgi:hypothetical protein